MIKPDNGTEAIPLKRVQLLDLRTQLRLHRLAWSRTLTIPWGQRVKHAIVLALGPLLALSLLLLTVMLTGLAALLLAGSGSTLARLILAVAAAIATLLTLTAALSAAAGGLPASVALAAASFGRVWTTPNRDAVATSTGLGPRRTIGNHYAHGHGTRLRLALVRQLLADGRTVRFKAGGAVVEDLYRHELDSHLHQLDLPDVEVNHVRGRVWELRRVGTHA